MRSDVKEEEEEEKRKTGMEERRETGGQESGGWSTSPADRFTAVWNKSQSNVLKADVSKLRRPVKTPRFTPDLCKVQDFHGTKSDAKTFHLSTDVDETFVRGHVVKRCKNNAVIFARAL